MNWYKKAQEIKPDTIEIKFSECHATNGTYGRTADMCKIVAIQSAECIGSLIYLKDTYGDYKWPEKSLYLFHIAVNEEFQRQGIATRMIQEMLKKENTTYDKVRWSNLYPPGKALKDFLDKR